MMMNENGTQFQISSSMTVGSARSGFVSHIGLNSIPISRVMRSLIGPLWESSISAVYATTTGTVSMGRMKMV